MDVREAQFFIVITVEASYNLLSLESLNDDVYLLKCLLNVEEVHILVFLFRRLEQLQCFIVVEFWTAKDEPLSCLLDLVFDILQLFQELNQEFELLPSLRRLQDVSVLI